MGEFGQEGPVEFFGEIVAALVGGVDATFDAGENGVGCAGCASFILDVPELKVCVMLAGDQRKPVGWCIGRGRLGNGLLSRVRVNVPLAGDAIVELDDLGRGENDGPDLFRYWVEKINGVADASGRGCGMLVLW